MARRFTAIEIPEEIRQDLKRMRVPLPGARWIDAQNFHLTLKFAGDIDNRVAREFAQNLARIEPDGFEIRLSGVGSFGSEPHAIWAGVAPSTELDQLQRLHEKAARDAGLAAEKLQFKPHVTLARLKHANVDAVARFLTRNGAYQSDAFFVTRTLLMSSRPSVGGGPYAIEDSFPMRGMQHLEGDEHAEW